MKIVNGETVSQRGFTLVELLVTLLLMGVVVTAGMDAFVTTTSHYHDQKVKTAATEQARMLVDLIAFDIRMTGAGMPLSQSGFSMSDGSLGDAPFPILTSSDADTVVVRLNETGAHTLVSSNYTPSFSDLDISVLSSSGLAVGDTIYLSNLNAGGSEGLKGTISAVIASPPTLTIGSGYLTTTGAVFASGSTVHKVSTVTFESPVDWSGITRDSGSGAQLLFPGSQFSVRYLDESGASLALPLSTGSVANDLERIEITVSVRGLQPLRDGTTYIANARETVVLRNLVVNRL